MRRRLRAVTVALLLALAPATAVELGCATKTTTVTTDRNGEKETTVTEERVVDRPTGILSGVFNVVGEIIALPFRIVAGIVQLIF